MSGGFRLELRVDAPGHRVKRYTVGTFGSAFALLLLLASAVFLGLGVAELPTRLSSSLQQKETAALLGRRTQGGERLRTLAARYEALEHQTVTLVERVDRVRRLYGLPELPEASRPPSRPAPRPDTTIFAAALLHVERLAGAIEVQLASVDAQLAVLRRWELEQPELVRGMPARLPISSRDAVPVARYGPVSERGEAGFQAGVELAAPEGTPIVAPAAGIVRWAGEPPPNAGGSWWRLGTTVVVAHDRRYRTIYGHCGRVLVRVGQRVELGQPLATVGQSGLSVSPRLHYEVRRLASDGEWIAVDPLSLIVDLGRLEELLGGTQLDRRAIDPRLAAPLPAVYSR